MTPVVGIIMGSDSDLPVMTEGSRDAGSARKFHYELTIVSAHRDAGSSDMTMRRVRRARD